jgi:glycosyltransferase 2 family protein
MRNFILALALLLGVVFVIGKFGEVQAIAETLQRGDWRYLALAFFVQSGWLINLAFSYRTIYRALDINESAIRLLPLATAANFLNIVAPSGGMSGMAVLINEARRRDYSPGKATVAGVLAILFDYGAFLGVLTAGLFVLFRRKSLDAGEVGASFVLLFIFLVLATLIYLGMHSAERLGRALAWISRQVNRVFYPFLKRPYLSVERAHVFARDAADSIHIISQKPVRLIAPSLLAISKQVLLITVFFLTFLAFKVEVTPGTLIAGYSIGYLFVIVSPTPAGLGVVEGMLTLVLTSLYVPFSQAAIVTLAYRGFTFWIPFFVGMASLRWLEFSKGRQIKSETIGDEKTTQELEQSAPDL